MTQAEHSRTPGRGLLLVTAAVLSAASLGVGAAARDHRDRDIRAGSPFAFPITGFGGYNWSGAVTNISAQWKVPSIKSTSPSGQAATWVGAQDTSDNFFIQLGVLEIAVSNGTRVYEVFWSDTAKNFQPQVLGSVNAGDTTTSSMKRDSHGWKLTFVDKTVSFTLHKQVDYGVGQPFTQGEWLQEDPSPSSIAAQDVAYPDIANVKFTKIKVDGSTPRLKLSDGVTLSASGGVIRVPTKVHQDSFTLIAPTGVAKQYLIDARFLDLGSSAFGAEFARWPTTSPSERLRFVSVIVQSLQTGVSRMVNQTWPRKVSAKVGALESTIQTSATDFRTWSAMGSLTRGEAYTKVLADANQVSHVADILRRSLGLPPP